MPKADASRALKPALSIVRKRVATHWIRACSPENLTIDAELFYFQLLQEYLLSTRKFDKLRNERVFHNHKRAFLLLFIITARSGIISLMAVSRAAAKPRPGLPWAGPGSTPSG